MFKEKIEKLLGEGKVNIMIGYTESTGGQVRVFFTGLSQESNEFVFDDRCVQNLAVYVNKPEIKAIGKIGIVANLSTVKALLQLASESQIKDGQVIALAMNENNVIELDTFAKMEEFVANPHKSANDEATKKIQEILNMSREKRWEYWTNELSSCIKCYACRSACPMCYCTQCTVDCNQPQWIPVASHHQGNMEWHILRAMHLAGRCVGCGECSRACPVDIPISLLSFMLNDHIKDEFGQVAGTKATLDYALSSFKVEDKENFMR